MAFLQNVDSVYDIEWTKGVKYRDVRFAEELQFSVWNFEMADIDRLWRLFAEHEAECKSLLSKYDETSPASLVLPAYDQVLKCSNLFSSLLDARGAISVTERVAVIKRVRDLAVGTAKMWADQQELACESAKTGTDDSVPRRHSAGESTPIRAAAWTEWSVPAFAPSTGGRMNFLLEIGTLKGNPPTG